MGSANGEEPAKENPVELLPKLKECTAKLEEFSVKTQGARDASATANVEYVKEFEAVMVELSKLKDIKELEDALTADQKAALEVLKQEADACSTEINTLSSE